ncbi:MAG TPA: FAD binding domain-containing protein [Thermoanaerobaculia bacterium]|jgi:xanthine dehydrogenase small subunit|nr:FAD binding domain-containing protein [Thermoanaerobaculia bacterium]
MRDTIVLHVNGREHRVRGRAAFATLSNWLRYDEGATGTKIVCEEGDCGACSVLVRRSPDEEFRVVNSCIQAMYQLDGTSVVTVEGLALDGALSGVQQAMVAHHGAQCGYCTPGFVVAMAALYENRDRVDEPTVRAGLTGNLCRCTGYEPIIKAALAVDGSAEPRLKVRYPEVPAARDALQIERFFAPATIEDAVRFKAANPGCTIVQGATDVGVWVNKRHFTAPALLSLQKIRALDGIGEEGGVIVAGANATLADFERFVEKRIPELFHILNIFGSPQIRNAGTLAGNIANGSPIADTLPYLFVSDAELELTGTEGTRRVPVNQFYLGYKKFDLQPDELITRVFVPVVRDTLRLYKVSRRRDLDISAFTAAFRVTVDGGSIATARIAYGGVGPVVLRMAKTEAALLGKPATLATFEAAAPIARAEVTPISDVRGSRDYRLQLAENILSKFWWDALGRA